MFYDRYVKLCSTKGKSPSAVAIELGIGKSTVSCWKRRGNSPTDAVTQKIADYFGVPVSELTEEQKEKPTVKDDGLDEKALDMLLERMTIAELQELMGKTAAAMAKRAQNG